MRYFTFLYKITHRLVQIRAEYLGEVEFEDRLILDGTGSRSGHDSANISQYGAVLFTPANLSTPPLSVFPQQE